MKIIFVDGTAGFSPTRLGDKPTGGISTSLTLIPQFLSKMGLDVWVKSAHPKSEIVGGVHYVPLDACVPRMETIVYNRNVVTQANIIQAKAMKATTVWWLHDIVDHRYLVDGSYKGVDSIISLSDYCTNTYSEFYNIPKSKFTVIPNGVDTTRWFPGQYEKRDPNLFLYASALVKGFYPIEFTYSNLKRHLPDLDFRIYGSQTLHDMPNNDYMQAWRNRMAQLGAKVHDPIPQKDLASLFRKAWCLLMPNSYPEICSNLILQARACGLPIVTSPIGSAHEWITHEETGLITKWMPHDKFMWWRDFALQVVRLVDDKSLHKHISKTAPRGIPAWAQIGKAWYRYVCDNRKAKSNLVGIH